MLDGSVDPGVNFLEGDFERGVGGVKAGDRGSQAGAQEAIIGAREEQGGAKTKLGDAIAEAVGDALEHACLQRDNQGENAATIKMRMPPGWNAVRA